MKADDLQALIRRSAMKFVFCNITNENSEKVYTTLCDTDDDDLYAVMQEMDVETWEPFEDMDMDTIIRHVDSIVDMVYADISPLVVE